MSFDTESEKENSYKVILAELDLPARVNNILNYEAGIWVMKINWNGITVTDDYGVTGYYSEESDIIIKVGSLSVDGENYTEVSSLVNLRIQNKSFLFSQGEQTIHIHFDSWVQPQNKQISVGATSGYCDKPQLDDNGHPTESYYDNIYYSPRILEVPPIKIKKDNLFYGILQFGGGSVRFNNSDGNFDDFTAQDIYGQACRILLGFNGLLYSQFRTVLTGYVDDYSRNYDTFTINIVDRRKFLKRKLPIRTFNQTDYPDLSDDNVDVVKPIAWGRVRKAPCVCLNEMEDPAPATYEFMFLDTTDNDANSLSTVYVDDSSVAIDSTDLAAGTFELDAGDYDPGQDVTADFIGFDDGDIIENGLDVYKDLMAIYADISYISDNYNLSEFSYERNKAPDIALWIGDGEEMTIEEAGKKISESTGAIIIFQANGKITARSYYSDRSISKTISDDEWIDDPQIRYPANEFLSSAVCLYNRDIGNDKYRRYKNDDYESTVFDKYSQYREKEFPTLLVNSTDADSKTENVLELSQEIWQYVTRKTKTQNIDLEIMHFIVANHGRPSAGVETAKYEVMGMQIALSKAEIQFDMRYVESYTIPEVDYQQGIIWYEYIFNDFIHTITEY